MIDIAIIGAGPAGLSAAINAVIRNKKTVVFGNKAESSYLYKAEKIDNYLGMPGLSGKEMIDKFYKHAMALGVEIQNKKVQQIFNMGDNFTLNADNEFFEAKKIIITTGIPKSNFIKGEQEFIGKGVSYCATCDGLLYKNKVVCVIGETKEAESDVEYLSEICKKVYYTPLYKNINAFNSNVDVVIGKPLEIYGDKIVKGIIIGDNNINADGIFFIKESIPINRLIEGLEMDNNYIKVNKLMETNIEGIYAAGDCTGRPLQLSKAVGDGLVAAQNAVLRLTKNKENTK